MLLFLRFFITITITTQSHKSIYTTHVSLSGAVASPPLGPSAPVPAAPPAPRASEVEGRPGEESGGAGKGGEGRGERSARANPSRISPRPSFDGIYWYLDYRRHLGPRDLTLVKKGVKDTGWPEWGRVGSGRGSGREPSGISNFHHYIIFSSHRHHRSR